MLSPSATLRIKYAKHQLGYVLSQRSAVMYGLSNVSGLAGYIRGRVNAHAG